MLAEKEVAAPAPSINTDPIFVAIEMSRSKWVVGTHIPTSSKVGIHTVEWGDVAALLVLVERLRSRAADVVGIADVPVLCWAIMPHFTGMPELRYRGSDRPAFCFWLPLRCICFLSL